MSDQPPSTVLSHLTSTQIHSLINRYYCGEKVATLIAEYGIKCSIGELYQQFPPEDVGRSCPVCAAPLIKPRTSRSSSTWKNRGGICCSSCAHQERDGCLCPSCSKKRANEVDDLLRRKRIAITNFCTANWSYEITEIEPEHFSSETAVALLSLIRSGGWLNDSTINAIGQSQVSFVPMENTFKQYLVKTLIDNGLIAPSPESPLTAFNFTHGEELNWELDDVYWTLRLPEAPEFIEKLEILTASDIWPEGWKEGVNTLWKMLAIAECWEYCAYAVKQRKLPMPGRTALIALLDNLLREYSVSQCYQLIWNAAGRAVDYMVRENIRPQHAANALIGNCQRYADRARAEGWAVKGFRRNFDLPRSQLSYVLHDAFFRHSEFGFTAPIGLQKRPQGPQI